MLERLKRSFYYSNFIGLDYPINSDGTIGTPEARYSEPVAERMNVSPAKGSADGEMFGNLLEYDRVIATRNINTRIQENTIVWLDGKKPPEDSHNYIVIRKAISNNFVVFALKRVEISS